MPERRSASRSIFAALRALFLAAAMLAAGCATVDNRPPPPSIDDLVKMAADKVPADEIIRRMQESGAVYRLNGSDYAKLRERGLPDAVIDYMHRRQLDRVRYEEWVRAHDRYLFPPYWYRPYPYPYPLGSPYWGGPWGPYFP